MASLSSWLISLIIITLLLASILTPTFLAIFLKNENKYSENTKINFTNQTTINQAKIKTITLSTKNDSENVIFYETNGFINNVQGIRISGKNYEDIAVSSEAKIRVLKNQGEVTPGGDFLVISSKIFVIKLYKYIFLDG